MSEATDLVTIEEARARLRIDGDSMDADLALAIAGASAAVMTYLKRDPYPEGEVPPNVKNATLILTGMFIRDPDGAEAQEWQQGYLPNSVTALLYGLRDPAST
jgi:hypothetical protein